jgi:hypothetical protein
VNAEDHEAQREALADAIHKRMTSSYIGAPPPKLRGDAERAVWAVIHERWQPPVTDALIDDTCVARVLEHLSGLNGWTAHPGRRGVDLDRGGQGCSRTGG